MNRTERQRLVVGSIVLVTLIAISGALLWARNRKLISEEYIIITTLPVGAARERPLQEGAAVIMDGSRIGMVRKVSFSSRPPGLAVRMSVSREAFGKIGPDSVAWLEPSSTGSHDQMVVLKGGKPSTQGQFIKIRPVQGLEGPPED